MIFAAILALFELASTLTRIGCPFRFLTGIPCPGCGMSRAALALVTGHVGAAWAYHPLVFVVIPYLIYLFLGSEDTLRKRRIKNAVSAVVILGFLVLYVLRLASGELAVDLSKGLVFRIYGYLFGT